MRSLALFAALVVLCVAAPKTYGAEPSPALRRFALVVSSNDGGRDRTKLRFADSDGRSIADVLRELGGLRSDDLLLVPNATRELVKKSFDQLRGMMTAHKSGPRREVLVYYSGHSDEEGLLLAGERVTYRELREWIHDTGADVRIAILDSCASGALIRQRGGTRSASFLDDRSVNARGHAFLTASSAHEAAQESDRIGAAFFTHYLVSGLRGAADTNRDGIVTLGEAYQFAYHETLRRTEQTSGGAQHPAYDIQLAGIGDLVLTDLRATSSTLQLDQELAGRVHVRDSSNRLVAELHKTALHAVVLGLAPGRYSVSLADGRKNLVASITITSGAVARLGAAQFGVAPVLTATARGGTSSTADDERAGTFLDSPSWRKLGGYAGMNWRYSRMGDLDAFNPTVEFAVRYRQLSFGIAGGAAISATDADGHSWTMGYGGFVVRYDFLFGASPFYLSIGALAAAGGAEKQVETAAMSIGGEEDSNVWVFEPQLAGRLNITRWLRLGIDLGYRSVAPGSAALDSDDLRGVTGGFTAQVGWF